MIFRVLCMPMPGLLPEVKYFLVRFVQCFGGEGGCTLGVRELAKRFGITDRRVSDARAALVSGGFLECSSVSIGRGRPKSTCRLTSTFRECLDRSSSPVMVFGVRNSAAIQHLLMHERREQSRGGQEQAQRMSPDAALSHVRAGRQPGRLCTVDRLVLSVLLCHADDFGVVRNLGSSDLRALTGFEPESLKQKIARLLDLGFIRAYAPGATSKVMLGKVKSTYFLNLHHSELAGACPAATVLVCATVEDVPDALVVEAGELYSAQAHESRRQQFAEISGFFPKQEGRRIEPVLRQKVDFYASAMLSEGWSQLSEIGSDARLPAPTFLPGLRERFVAEFQPSRRAKGDGDDFPTERQCSLLVEHLFEKAFRLACRVKQHFADIQDVPLEGMRFLFLPRVWASVNRFEATVCRSVLAMPKNAAAGHGCYVIAAGAPTKFANETDIPLSSRYAYGLLTKPSAS